MICKADDSHECHLIVSEKKKENIICCKSAWCFKGKPWSFWTRICPVFANSVDPDQLASSEANWSGSTLSGSQFVKFVSTTWIKQSDWLKMRSWCGILIYSAWQGLSISIEKWILDILSVHYLDRDLSRAMDTPIMSLPLQKEAQLQIRAFFNQNVFIFFLFLNKNICCGYSLEAPRRGASNEYPQHMFL